MNEKRRKRLQEALESFMSEMVELYDYTWEDSSGKELSKEDILFETATKLDEMSDTQFSNLCEKIVDIVFDTF